MSDLGRLWQMIGGLEKRIAKLEAQVESLRKRLDARTSQLILVLSQIAELKEILAEHGLEVTVKPVDFSEAEA